MERGSPCPTRSTRTRAGSTTNARATRRCSTSARSTWLCWDWGAMATSASTSLARAPCRRRAWWSSPKRRAPTPHWASRESYARLSKAATIVAAEPVRAVVITGYTSTAGLSEAEQMATEWPGGAPLLLEVAGRDTAENATRSLPLILALGGIERVTVVTSAWHFRARPYFAPYRRFWLRLDFQPDWTRGGWLRMLWNELRLTPRVPRARRGAWSAVRLPPGRAA